MHGSRLGSSLLVNAEVDSMGGIIDGGVGNHIKSSPHLAAIDRAQWDLRLEYDVREERRKELEFLEKGGDPLDFKFELAASVSGLSTSLTNQLHSPFVTSEAKNSFALAASPRGDSVGSCGRLGTTLAYEANSADNFDGENELIESERKSRYPRSSVTPLEHSSQHEESNWARDLEEPPCFQPKKAYRRRYRPKLAGDGARSGSTDIASHGVSGPSLPSFHSIIKKPVLYETQSDGEANVADAVANNPVNGGRAEDKFASEFKNTPADVDIQNIEAVGADVTASVEANLSVGVEHAATLNGECSPCSVEKESEKLADLKCNRQLNKCQIDHIVIQTEGPKTINSNALDRGFFCDHSRVSTDGNGNTEHGLFLKNEEITGEVKECKDSVEKTSNNRDSVAPNERSVANITDRNGCPNDTCFSQSHQTNDFLDNMKEETSRCMHSAQKVSGVHPDPHESLDNHQMELTPEMKKVTVDDSDCHLKMGVDKLEGLQDPYSHDLANNYTSDASTAHCQPFGENKVKLNDRELEDHILEEARIIEAKRQRITELSLRPQTKEYCSKSHWDFVLEEMSWLANDFAQERLWKAVAAAQIGEQAAYASWMRFEGSRKRLKLRFVAHTMAKAVTEFWFSAELLLEKTSNGCGSKTVDHDTVACGSTDKTKIGINEIGGVNKDQKICGKSIWRYAVRFLQHNSSMVPLARVGCIASPEDVSMTDTPEVAHENLFSEETLFYVVPNGAMQVYRRSVERYSAQFEECVNNMPEEVQTSVYDAVSDNDYEEDGENMHFLSGADERSMAPKLSPKIRKTLKVRLPRSCGVAGGFPYDSKNSTSKSILVGKRLPNGLNMGSIPTKRVRTASRQRVGPFGGGAAGILPAACRAEASSGDTNSFHDDQGSRGYLFPKGSEVESKMDLGEQLAFDASEIPGKPKKKKNAKLQGMLYDPRWHLDPGIESVQRDKLKKRLNCHQYGTNGSSGLYGPHAKKIKLIKPLDSSLENTSGSIASPLASQMSNMSNSSKLVKLIGGRDRGRRVKGLMAAVQPGSGSPWSTFEDQALVVLVHDIGANWELVSDTMNNSLQTKCIFRQPQECKERHKALMDSSSGDGGDSAEDSGSSQLYPSTLPGIPKGSARQLFQQLRDPIEEDTIRSHFEKIILVGQGLLSNKNQVRLCNNIQEHRQLVPVHGSHAAALMQVLPNNFNGTVLTPLDLCDTAVSSPDVFSLGYQATHYGGLSLPNQGPVQPMPSVPNILLQGSAGIGIDSNRASSPSAQHNHPERRDERYSLPRASVPMDEQRIQQFNRMLSSSNMLQPNMSEHGAFPRMIPGGNGLGIMPGINRSMSMFARPEIQGIPSPSLNSGNVAASNTIGMNMRPGPTVHGNSIIGPQDALQIDRNTEHPRQLMPPKMRMQALQTSNQGIFPPFGGFNSEFPSQLNSPSAPLYPARFRLQNHQITQHSNLLSNSHHPHMQGSSHAPTLEQQAFAMRLARDRQLQQRMLQRQQQRQQFPNSSALVSPSISTSLPNSPQIQAQASSQPAVSVSPPLMQASPVTPVGPQQLSHPYHALGRTPQSRVGGKQPRQQNAQQPFEQSGSHHPQHPQPSHQLPQQQSKPMKGIGKGNILRQLNLSADPSHQGGLSCDNSGGLVVEKAEQNMHAIQGQGYPVQSSKTAISPSPAMSSSLTVRRSDQGLQPSTRPPLNNTQQLKEDRQQYVKVMNRNSLPNAQRVALQNRVLNSDMSAKPLVGRGEQLLANNISSNNMVVSGALQDSTEPRNAGVTSGLTVQSLTPQMGAIGRTLSSDCSANDPLGSGGLNTVSQCPSNSFTFDGHGSGPPWVEELQNPHIKLPLSSQSLPSKQKLEQIPKKQSPSKPQPHPQALAAPCHSFSKSNSDL